MASKRIILAPGNNSLSHMAKCIAIAEELPPLGGEPLIIATPKSAKLFRNSAIPYEILPDIQENDGSTMPTIEWFKHSDKIMSCIQAESRLLKTFRPDRVLGVFRFTSKIAAALSNIPFDSLICGCMLPGEGNILGFNGSEEKASVHKKLLEGFFGYATKRMNPVFEKLGLDKIGDIRQLLTGERTFLWDVPEFNPLLKKNGEIHAGPISWKNWPFDHTLPDTLFRKKRPFALVTSGTCGSSVIAVKKISQILLALGYDIIIAAGGQEKLYRIMADNPRVTISKFAPFNKILPHVSLIVSHGGQMTIFEALQNKVPVLVIPLQPEQAHNGLCLERIGCGMLLAPPVTFVGDSRVYVNSFLRQEEDEMIAKIKAFLGDQLLSERLANISRSLFRYDSVRTIARLLLDKNEH